MKERIVKKLVKSLFLLTLFPCLSLSGQQEHRYMLFNGVVMDATTLSPLPNAYFIISRGYGGVTDEEGRFSFYLEKGDTVLFTYLGYQDALFMPSDTLSGNRFVAGIFLESDTLSIGEVIIFPRMADLRTEFMLGSTQLSQDEINAQNNITISTYQGINSAATLGDPQSNYEVLRRQQVINAYERGGIPSDKMIGLNFVAMIPGVAYLLAKGFPERPDPPKPHITASELEKMKASYKKSRQEEDYQR